MPTTTTTTSSTLRLAIIGATGLVGREVLGLLTEEKHFRTRSLRLIAVSTGKQRQITCQNKQHRLYDLPEALALKPHLVIFCTSPAVSRQWAERFVEQGAYVVDNSPAFRSTHPLVVPELGAFDPAKLIANPNCVAIQLAVAIAGLHAACGINVLTLSTYQAISGAGAGAVAAYQQDRQHNSTATASLHNNVLAQIGELTPQDDTEEEAKVRAELRLLLRAPDLRVYSTCVRVPVLRGHAVSLYVEFARPISLHQARSILEEAQGVVLLDSLASPATARHQDVVQVSRLRTDPQHPKVLQAWIVGDNLRKGAATNALQICEQLVQTVPLLA